MTEWYAVLPPYVVIFAGGVYFAYKYLKNGRGNCPAQNVLQEQRDKSIQQTEAFKSMCISLDRNSAAIKEATDSHSKSVERLAECFIEGMRHGRD